MSENEEHLLDIEDATITISKDRTMTLKPGKKEIELDTMTVDFLKKMRDWFPEK